MGLFSNRSNRIAASEAGNLLFDYKQSAQNLLDNGLKSSLSSLGAGYDTARDGYKDAINLYEPYAKTGGKAFDLYSDAMGVNGKAAADTARASFKESPGYQYMVDQATDQTARKMSALGALGSGNTITAIQDRAANLADQEWGDWLTGLSDLGEVGYNATNNKAALTKGLGDLGYQYGTDKATLYTGVRGQMAGNEITTGAGQANLRMKAAEGSSNPAANAWGLGMNLAKLASGFAGQMWA